jgi:hypothetical protein
VLSPAMIGMKGAVRVFRSRQMRKANVLRTILNTDREDGRQQRLDNLAASYLRGAISLEEYLARVEKDNYRLDLREIASKLPVT